MPQNPIQIYPNDLIANRAIGVRLPLSQNGVFGSTFTTQDAIKYNLVNYLLTNPGEIPGNPTFGAGLRQFIFDQIQDGNVEGIEEAINTGINENFSDVDIEEVTISATEDRNQLQVNITYRLPSADVLDELELNFN